MDRKTMFNSRPKDEGGDGEGGISPGKRLRQSELLAGQNV